MKRISAFLFGILLLSSCSWLDVSPDLGMTEEEVFSNYTNFKNYLYSAYHGGTQLDFDVAGNIFRAYCPIGINSTTYRFTMNTITDISDSGRPLRSHVMKGGFCGDDNARTFVNGRAPIFATMWIVNRIANRCIENIDRLQGVSDPDKYDLLAQAYFLRALAHFTLCNYFGGMPYVDHALSGDDSFDLPRLSSRETYDRVAQDAWTAYEYFDRAGLVRRDPMPGEAGNLQHSEINHAAGIAALALRSRALLYAASPLSNPEGDVSAWAAAAEAASFTLDTALEYGYYLLPFDEWENNWKYVDYTNEQLWAWTAGAIADNNDYIVSCNAYPMTNNKNGGAVCPTQNAVDMYETAWGDPLNTEADREAAAALGHYNEQRPYVNRDPRFYKLVVYDGASSEGAPVINIYYNPDTGTWPTTALSGKSRYFGYTWGSQTGMGVSNTGYYSRKWWDGKYTSTKFAVTDPLFRLAEIYLNYAEAANEAWGPNGGVAGQISAVDAVNVVRDRALMPPVLARYAGDKDLLRERIQNERAIEFMDEGVHYFLDIRRWKVAPERMRKTLYGMYIESCPVSAEHPAGRNYVRTPLSSDRQSTWKDEMYYFFLPAEEANKFSVFENNPTW
ncbi:MAG: RagB/SusD family nutrient uptake outer membrane protein [Bacteroidales bacterium]|nr:RagB/SusD family nutrient uptake outer membrane protein [Bacteroidales bacterium]